jgi:parvulin-like peptidyl-prolyl isomerase
MRLLSLTLSLLTVLNACQRSTREASLELPDDKLERLEQELGYAPGVWWQSPRGLTQVRLSARHILVSHDALEGQHVLLGARLLPVARTREQALRRAVAIARRLQAAPDSFEQLARSYSDDRASAQVGGSLGVFVPLSVPRVMVDALGALKEGAVSHVFESELGFQIVQRLPVAKEQRLSYSHIVVAHEHALPIRGRVHARSRSRAAERVAQLAHELAQAPTRFAELASTQSDATDANRAGDQGSFATYEAGAPALLLEVVRRLAPGAVSEPIETEAGFEILQRTPERKRTRYTFTELTLPFQGSGIPLAGVTNSEAEARALGEQLLAALRGGLSFESAVSTMCVAPACQSHVRTDVEGRGLADAEHVILQAPPGTVGEMLLSSLVGFHVVRREQTAEAEPNTEPVRFELPAAQTLEEVIGESRPDELAAATRRVGREAVSALDIKEPRVVELFDELAENFARERAERRVMHLLEIRGRLRELLGEADALRIAQYVRGGLNAPSGGGARSSHEARP